MKVQYRILQVIVILWFCEAIPGVARNNSAYTLRDSEGETKEIIDSLANEKGKSSAQEAKKAKVLCLILHF